MRRINLYYPALIMLAIVATTQVMESEADPGTGNKSRFEVTLKVTYNSITLDQAAMIERMARDQYKDACKVDIDLKPANRAEPQRWWYIHNTDLDTVTCSDSLVFRFN